MNEEIRTVPQLEQWIESHRAVIAHRTPNEIAEILTAAGVADFMVVRSWLQRQTSQLFKSY